MKRIVVNGLRLSSDSGVWGVEGGGELFQLKEPGDFWRVVSLLETEKDLFFLL